MRKINLEDLYGNLKSIILTLIERYKAYNLFACTGILFIKKCLEEVILF